MLLVLQLVLPALEIVGKLPLGDCGVASILCFLDERLM
mgnify:CR=1 FL=1